MSANAVEIRGLEKSFPTLHARAARSHRAGRRHLRLRRPQRLRQDDDDRSDLRHGREGRGIDHGARPRSPARRSRDEAAGRLRQPGPALQPVGPRPQGHPVRARLLPDVGPGVLRASADSRSASARDETDHDAVVRRADQAGAGPGAVVEAESCSSWTSRPSGSTRSRSRPSSPSCSPRCRTKSAPS